MHSGYGFAIGNVAAFDMDDPAAVVSPGGVGFDINCGVRLVRTNLVWPSLLPRNICYCKSCLRATSRSPAESLPIVHWLTAG